MTGHPFRQPFRSIGIFHIAHNERVESDDLLIGQCDIGLRRARLLVGPGKPGKETIKGIASAIELIDVMGSAELFDTEDH